MHYTLKSKSVGKMGVDNILSLVCNDLLNGMNTPLQPRAEHSATDLLVPSSLDLFCHVCSFSL